MLTVALTGGIGSGKTAVTELFQELASEQTEPIELTIIDADIIARDLLSGSLKEAPVDSALQQVQILFGANLFNQNGFLQRDKLRSLIFSSKEKKKQLESLLHPLVYNEIFTQLSAIHLGIVIVAIPLLFETRAVATLKRDFDRILVIDTKEDLQIKRTLKRDNSSESIIREIIQSQVERKTRLKFADDVINNSGTLSELKSEVAHLFHKYSYLGSL
ncbi:MAG: dephospho-CoA kinase [Gammaproteobacteria bacterium]|nr:dephospho-CoA kinase [Gammaproteobacteria bacterium]